MKSQPLTQPVVTFHNIKAEIYAKAKQRASDSVVNGSSGDNNDNKNDNSDGDSNDDGSNNDDDSRDPAVKGGDFELDNDIDLMSPFLCNMVSDKQLTPDLMGLTTPVAATDLEINHDATAEEWENM